MIWIDNRPLERIAGARAVSATGFLTASRGTRAIASVPGRLGVLVGGLEAAAPRRAALVFRVPVATLADRPAAIATVEGAFAGAVRSIRTADRPDVHTRCLVEAITWRELDGATGMVHPSLLCEVELLAVDGGSDQWPTPGPVLLGTTRTMVPVGSIPTGGWLFLWGGSSPLTVTYRSANGQRVATCVITQALATGQHLAGDVETGDVWFVTATTRTRVSAMVGELPLLDPADALGTVRPTLQLSSGTGLLVPSLRYRL
jgi:hypothetical protein